MGFTATRTPIGSNPTSPSKTPSTINVFDVGGGVAAPANGTDLLNLLNNYMYALGFDGQQTTLSVTPGAPKGSITIAPSVTPSAQPPAPTDPSPGTVPLTPTGVSAPVVRPSVIITAVTALAGTPGTSGGGLLANSDYSTLNLNGISPVWGNLTPLEAMTYKAGSLYFRTEGTGPYQLAVSTDGTNWTLHGFPESGPGLAASNGSIFVIAQAGGIYSSPDGVTWTRRVNLGSYNGLCFAAGKFVTIAVPSGDYRRFAYTSTDGVTWVQGDQVNGGNLTYAQGKFWTVSFDLSGGTVSSSSDGTSWGTQTTALGGRFQFMAGSGSLLAIYSSVSGILTSADGGATWIYHAGASLPSLFRVYADGTKFYQQDQYNPTTYYYESSDGYTWNSVAMTSPGTPGVSITQADINAWNAQRRPTDILVTPGVGYDPLKMMSTATLLQYPVQVPADFVTGAVWFKFFHGSSFGRETGYIVFSMNQQFYDAKHGIWTDAMTDYCKIGLFKEWDFLAAINLPFYWSDKPHHIFFATGYSLDGFTKTGVELVVIAQPPAPPAYVEIQSGGKFLNFRTGYLDPVRSGDTTLQVPWQGAAYTDGSTMNTWNVCVANMPDAITAGALSVVDNLPSAAANLQIQDVIVMPTGIVPATSSPFTLLCSLGATEISAPPAKKTVQLGTTEQTAPPARFSRSVLGLTEATSSTAHLVTAVGVVEHTGQPFTSKG